MRSNNRTRTLGALGLGILLAASTGCQTWMGGMTLPSGRYLEHVPQYFPAEPDFPLQKELAYQEETAGLTAPAGRGAIGPGVNPVPPGAGMPLGR